MVQSSNIICLSPVGNVLELYGYSVGQGGILRIANKQKQHCKHLILTYLHTLI